MVVAMLVEGVGVVGGSETLYGVGGCVWGEGCGGGVCVCGHLPQSHSWERPNALLLPLTLLSGIPFFLSVLKLG